MLEIRKLCATYGDLQVLWDVDLDVRKGEIVTVVGANGAGKSTLLKSISRIIASTATCLRFGDSSLLCLPSHEVVSLGVVQIPEGRHIFPEMTVMENLRMGSYLPAARRERKRSLERAFSLFPRLEERQRQLGGTLSGGEQQMLAIARGLMANPSLLLLDEPSLGLAPLLARQIFQIIERIRQQGTSVLLVEQNVYQSLKISDRAYVFATGRVVLEGKGSELLDDERIKTAFLGMDASPLSLRCEAS